MKAWGTIALTLVALLTILALLSGCSVLEDRVDEARDFAGRHPAVTAVTGALVGAAITIAVEHHGHHEDAFHHRGVTTHNPSKARPATPNNFTTQPVDCASNPYQCK